MNRGLDARRFPRALTVVYTSVAAVAALGACAVNLASYGPDELGPTLINVALVLFPLAFPMFFIALGALALTRLPVGLLLGDLPRPVIAVGLVVFVYVFINFFRMVALMPGQPEQQGQSYVLNDHGALTVIDVHQYQRGLMYGARLFSGHAILFLGVCAAIGYQIERVRSGKLDTNVGPRDIALEQRPLPAPLARSVTLQTMLSPAECTERLRRPIPQGFFSTMGRYGVRGESTADGFRLELGGMQSSMVFAVGRYEGDRPTFIRVLLTFKRWTLIGLVGGVVLIPVAVLLISGLGWQIPWELLVFMIVFAVGGNLVFGLVQMNSLLNQIKRATGSQQVAIG